MILREYKEPTPQSSGPPSLVAPSQIEQAKSGVERESKSIMQSLSGISQRATQAAEEAAAKATQGQLKERASKSYTSS